MSIQTDIYNLVASKMMREGGAPNQRQIAEQLGVSRALVCRSMRRMARRGMLRRDGDGKYVRYIPAEFPEACCQRCGAPLPEKRAKRSKRTDMGMWLNSPT